MSYEGSIYYLHQTHTDLHPIGRVNPEKMDDFNNVSLSRQKITRRIAELSPDQVTEKSKSFDFFSIACDESTDASDTAQLLIF